MQSIYCQRLIKNNEHRGEQFQWGSIFIPDGSSLTCVEIGFPKKEQFSQGTKAWKELIVFLNANLKGNLNCNELQSLNR